MKDDNTSSQYNTQLLTLDKEDEASIDPDSSRLLPLSSLEWEVLADSNFIFNCFQHSFSGSVVHAEEPVASFSLDSLLKKHQPYPTRIIEIRTF